jgi:hypothetical protein
MAPADLHAGLEGFRRRSQRALGLAEIRDFPKPVFGHAARHFAGFAWKAEQ